MDERYAQILQLLESFKAESADEVSKLRKENEELKQQIQNLCKSGSKMQAARSSMTYSAMAMADVHRMAKDPELMDKISENSDANDGSGNFDGMDLTASVAVDPSKSSYATGYNYNLLKSSEVLVTMHDVGDANKDIDNGPGMWANYILNKERNSTLKVCNKTRLLKEGKYYHFKSIREGLPIKELVEYCYSRGIKAIVPTSVSDEIYLSTNISELQANNIWPLCCEDPQSYITLDHKWLSYEFCVKHGIPQAETLPLRVDTVDACRALAENTIADGKPCFLKECFDTCAGDGVIKVDKMEDYDDAINRISQGKGPQPKDTCGVEQHIIIQAGHPGRIACCHNIFYKGELVSLYVTKENMAIMDKLGDARLDMALGTWSPNKDDLSTSLKLDLDNPCDKNIRDQAISTMKVVGKALNYTGMLEVEFIVANKPDAVVNVLEFNPRFSGACHSYVGAGMVQDYMHVLGLVASTKDDTDVVMKVARTTHVRSDTHLPKSNFKDYNVVKFYLKQPGALLKLRNLLV